MLVIGIGVFGITRSSCRDDERPRPQKRELSPVIATEFVDGVALAIVYDTSGSMKDEVKDATGTSRPKYVIANRALEKVVDQLEAWSKSGTEEFPHRLECALVRFSGKAATDMIALSPFAPAPFRAFAQSFHEPEGATPLGIAVQVAARAVLASQMLHKHVVVITDGKNTDGPDPADVLDDIGAAARAHGTGVGAHFVAFDVDASVFAGVKRSGAGVVSAADELQLVHQLHDILEKEVLLEVEDSPAAPGAAGR
jgi:Mg-chelatase subunit ChlD